jgi:FMN phosphatase YigB (HAD superfamily)/DNA-binding XRE family transcriptional regulator
MAMDEKGLGKRLQTARQQAGLTQQQLCHQANLSFSTLTKIERGAIKSPSIFTVQSIAAALGLGLDELVGLSTTVKAANHSIKTNKTKSGVSFIYFDVNGCLVHFYQRAFAKISIDTGIPADIVETAYWHFNDDACRGIITMKDFNAKMAERLGVEKVDWQAAYLETIEPILQMQELLVWASERYQIGLLTNIMPGLLPAMRQAGNLPHVAYDSVVDSSEVGAIKPEIKIFEIATEKSGKSPSDILLIDDSRPNLMAAEKFGWHVLWFDDSRPDEMVDRIRTSIEPVQS